MPEITEVKITSDLSWTIGVAIPRIFDLIIAVLAITTMFYLDEMTWLIHSSVLDLTVKVCAIAITMAAFNIGYDVSILGLIPWWALTWALCLIALYVTSTNLLIRPNNLSPMHSALVMGMGTAIAFTAFFNIFIGLAAWATVIVCHLVVLTPLVTFWSYLEYKRLTKTDD